MRLLNNSKLIVAIIILLLLSNTALITIIFLRSNVVPLPNPRINIDKPDWKHNKDRCRDGHPLITKLGLDEAQKEVFLQSKDKFRANTRIILDSLSGIRKQMLDILDESPTDTVKIYALADQVGALHAQLKQQTAFHYLEIRQVCNPEQQKMLNEFFRDMRHGPYHKKRKYCNDKN